MPQASETARNKMRARFGDIVPEGPIKYLESVGFILTPTFEWISPRADFTPEEVECIEFLMDEWDFGGVREVKP